MAAIIWSDVTGIAPELAGVSSGAQTLLLAQANAALDPCAFGGEGTPRLTLARVLYCAHFASVIGMGSVAGPVTQETGGGLAVQYAQPLKADDFNATGYGRQYLALVATSAARAWVLL